MYSVKMRVVETTLVNNKTKEIFFYIYSCVLHFIIFFSLAMYIYSRLPSFCITCISPTGINKCYLSLYLKNTKSPFSRPLERREGKATEERTHKEETKKKEQR